MDNARAQLQDEQGQAMVEYALILGLVSIVGLILSGIGNQVVAIFARVAASF
jgi:Flp pilus assembly pilin Flp